MDSQSELEYITWTYQQEAGCLERINDMNQPLQVRWEAVTFMRDLQRKRAAKYRELGVK